MERWPRAGTHRDRGHNAARQATHGRAGTAVPRLRAHHAEVTRALDGIRRRAPSLLAALFGASGTLHIVRPEIFLPLVPAPLPAPEAIILASGVAELACAAGLLARAPWAAPASALLLVAIFPGNIWFALDVSMDAGASPLLVAAAWARLPLQAPLIWAALQARRPDDAAGLA